MNKQYMEGFGGSRLVIVHALDAFHHSDLVVSDMISYTDVLKNDQADSKPFRRIHTRCGVPRSFPDSDPKACMNMQHPLCFGNGCEGLQGRRPYRLSICVAACLPQYLHLCHLKIVISLIWCPRY